MLDSYQHELSGGMRQRIGIVFALVLNAKVLILDEPTTALDMLSQASVLEIVRKVHDENQLSTLIITHDIGAISEIADRLAVMYGGRIVEDGPLLEVLRRPTHPYTKALIGATARITGDVDAARALPGRPPDLTTVARVGCVFRDRCPFAVGRLLRGRARAGGVGGRAPARLPCRAEHRPRRNVRGRWRTSMIEARGITRTYQTHGAFTGARTVHALRGVDFTLPDGGAVSFIGESGCGKTTLGKILTGLETFDGGELVVDGVELSKLKPQQRAKYFRRIQMIHQDPYSALNPTRTIASILGDPLRMRAKGDRRRTPATGASGPPSC